MGLTPEGCDFMPELFDSDWAKAYMDIWNADQDIVGALENASFSSIMGFGFMDDEKPSFVMSVENGKVVSVMPRSKRELDWDIRATKENWLSLIVKPPGLMRLGIAYTSRKLRFRTGEYTNMIKDPSLANAFVKSFALMGKVL